MPHFLICEDGSAPYPVRGIGFAPSDSINDQEVDADEIVFEVTDAIAQQYTRGMTVSEELEGHQPRYTYNPAGTGTLTTVAQNIIYAKQEAQTRRRIQELIAEARSYLQSDSELTAAARLAWLNYIAELRDLPNDPNWPDWDTMTIPSEPSLDYGSGRLTLAEIINSEGGVLDDGLLPWGIGGGNLIENTRFETLTGWMQFGTGVAHNNTTLSLQTPGSWAGGNYNTLKLFQSSASTDGYSEARTRRIDVDGSNEVRDVAVTPNAHYQVSVHLSIHRCTATVYIFWYEADGTYITASAVNATTFQGSTTNPDEWDVTWLNAQAPANAAFAAVAFRKWATTAGVDSYLFMHKPQLVSVPSADTPLVPYSPGVERLLDGGQMLNATLPEAKISGTISDTKIGSLNAAKLLAGTSIPTSVLVDGSSLGNIKFWANDPIARANALGTLFDGGKLQAGSVGDSKLSVVGAARLSGTIPNAVEVDGEQIGSVKTWASNPINRANDLGSQLNLTKLAQTGTLGNAVAVNGTPLDTIRERASDPIARANSGLATKLNLTRLADTGDLSGDIKVGGRALDLIQSRAMASDVLLDAFQRDWVQVQGSASYYYSVASSVCTAGERSLASNPEGLGWYVSKEIVPFDPTKLYRVTARLLRHSGSLVGADYGNCYIGVNGIAADGTTYVNVSGANTYGTQHYVVLVAKDQGTIPTVLTDYVGYIRGHAAAGVSNNTLANPAKMHSDTRFLQPMALFNHNLASGGFRMFLDFVKIEAVEDLTDVIDKINAGPGGMDAGRLAVGTTIPSNVLTNGETLGNMSVWSKDPIARANSWGTELDGAKLQDRTLGARKFQSGDFSNLCDEPAFESGGAGWENVSGPASITQTYKYIGTSSLICTISDGTSRAMKNRLHFSARSGDRFYCSVLMRGVSAAFSTAGVRIAWLDATRTEIGVGNVTVSSLGSAWTKVEGFKEAPAGTVYGRVECVVYSQTAGSVCWDGVYCYRANGHELIEDGKLVSDQLFDLSAAKLRNATAMPNGITVNGVNLNNIQLGASDPAARINALGTKVDLSKLASTGALGTGVTVDGSQLGDIKTWANNPIARANVLGTQLDLAKLAQTGTLGDNVAVSGRPLITIRDRSDDPIARANVLATELNGIKVQAGSIPETKLARGFGQNLLYNSDFVDDLDGHQFTGTGTSKTQTIMSLRPAGQSWAGLNFPTLMLYQNGTSTDGYSEWRNILMDDDGGTVSSLTTPIKPNTYYELSAKLSMHRCTGRLYIFWRDAAGTLIGAPYVDVPSGSSSSTNPEDWPRYRVLDDAPANALFAQVVFRKYGTNDGTSSYTFIHAPMFAEAHAHSSEAAAYSPGPRRYIAGARLKKGSLDFDRFSESSFDGKSFRRATATSLPTEVGGIPTSGIAKTDISGAQSHRYRKILDGSLVIKGSVVAVYEATNRLAATINFPISFVEKPVITTTIDYTTNANVPSLDQLGQIIVTSWITSGSDYTGAIVKLYRVNGQTNFSSGHTVRIMFDADGVWSTNL